MTDEQRKSYTARITQASRTELVLIMYEIMIEDIKEAIDAIGKSNIEEFINLLKHCRKFLHELMSTLDYTYKVSFELMSLYIYVDKTIVSCIFKKSDSSLWDVIDIITKLKDAYEEVNKIDTTGPVMKNSEQIYAGLTYGRGILNEVYLDPNESKRGFRA